MDSGELPSDGAATLVEYAYQGGRMAERTYSTYHQFHNVSLYDTLDWNCLNDAALIDKMEYTE